MIGEKAFRGRHNEAAAAVGKYVAHQGGERGRDRSGFHNIFDRHIFLVEHGVVLEHRPFAAGNGD